MPEAMEFPQHCFKTVRIVALCRSRKQSLSFLEECPGIVDLFIAGPQDSPELRAGRPAAFLRRMPAGKRIEGEGWACRQQIRPSSRHPLGQKLDRLIAIVTQTRSTGFAGSGRQGVQPQDVSAEQFGRQISRYLNTAAIGEKAGKELQCVPALVTRGG
uniref:hypothetical protein n=1 Tax=Mesorhizobium atlanticum TaxID=2233532 RepID=UPI0037048B9A